MDRASVHSALWSKNIEQNLLDETQAFSNVESVSIACFPTIASSFWNSIEHRWYSK